MSSLADAPDLVGFFSYSREDDEDSGGRLSQLRERIQAELRGQLGRTKRDFRLWQDKVAIAHGELWEDTIKKGISESVFFIPIITPTAVRSRFCKFEFETFLAREKELGRSNLVFPILYIPVPALADDGWRQDPLLEIIGSRQYEQWQNLRHLDPSSTEVALRVEKFCANICKALQQPWLSPQERQEAEARRAAEEERRRQEKLQQEAQQRAEEERRREEAETKRRLAQSEAEKRRQDNERRSLEEERTRAEEQRRKRLEQAPQQQLKPWLLPLIGAGAASLPMLLLAVWVASNVSDPSIYIPYIFVVMSHALYGGAAGMLIARFGIPKAVAIPVIPALLLILLVGAFFPLMWKVYLQYFLAVVGFAPMVRLYQTFSPEGWVFAVVVYFVPAVMCTWLAFGLHSGWVLKRRMIDSGLPP
jgi:TIR domain-containing protein